MLTGPPPKFHGTRDILPYVGTGPDGKTMERVQEIISTEELKARIDKGRQVDLISIVPVAYSERDLPVDPYVLGVILGDAHINKAGGVRLFSADAEIVEEIQHRSYAVRPEKVEKGRCPAYGISGLGQRLRALGLAGKRSWEKSIPEEYLFGSVEQRVDLLRGLMDTDGTISIKGEMEFTSSSQEFAEGVQTLVRSLGGRVAVNVKAKVMYTSPNQVEPKEGRPAFRVQNIRLPEINPFLLPRKADRWKSRTRGFNRVTSVEYLRDDLVQCIRVADERHLYLTDDFIPTHNTSNIVFLKSTDDSMLETLEKMSGTTHKSYIDSKQISQDLDKVIGGRTEGRVSYTMNTKEEPLVKYNDLAFISERNSIVFRAGDAPVWNRNETILPMSWRLFRDKIVHPGHDYSLQTIPTLSSALEFDVRMNQPDFRKMLDKRMKQAIHSGSAKDVYQESYGYADVDIARLDPDLYSDEVMEIVQMKLNVEQGRDPHAVPEVDADELDVAMIYDDEQIVDNLELAAEIAERRATAEKREQLIYAEGTISKDMLVKPDGTARIKSLDRQLTEAYKSAQIELQQDFDHFSVGADNELRSADGSRTYITPLRSSTFAEAARKLNGAARDGDSRVYLDDELSQEDLQALATVEISADFYRFLASLPTWEHLAGGAFDRAMAVEMLNL